MSAQLFGAIEAGGTKFVCGVGTASGTLVDEIRITTGHPADTMEEVLGFFRRHRDSLAAIGIGSFGPLQLNVDRPHYGFITSTPKIAWRDFDLLGTVQKALQLPVALDTDVNAAAVAEARWGAAQELRTFVYVTVGTGIGGAALIDGSPLHGLTHPEMGHMRVPHDVVQDPFPGVCPYHGDCLEGLASGIAIEQRWGATPSTLAAEHRAWVLEVDYLALACTNWIYTLSPERIVLGGGVMQRDLFAPLRRRIRELLNGYLDPSKSTENLGTYVQPSSLSGRAGVLGALALATRVVER